jgi:cell wall-associated NlpC family hydrolase
VTKRFKRLVTIMALATSVLGTAAVTPVEAAPRPLGQQAVDEAARHYEAPYSYGAAGPSRFDCSGLTMYVFKRPGRSLPHGSSAQYNANRVQHVSRNELRLGDLVFTIRNGKISHVGIYAGSNLMWAATQSGDVVRKQSLANRHLVFGRVT